MIRLKSLPKPLHFEAGAKQREQASGQDHAALDDQQNVDTAIKLGKVPEDGDAEKRAAEYEAETTQKQKYVIDHHVRLPKRNGDEKHAALKRNLHHAENGDRDEIGEAVVRKLLAGIDGDVSELGQCLPDKGDRSQYLEREQEQIDAGFSRLVVGVHAGYASKKRFLANAFPEPDLKYRSRLRAVTSSPTAKYERTIAGKNLLVETTCPCR